MCILNILISCSMWGTLPQAEEQTTGQVLESRYKHHVSS